MNASASKGFFVTGTDTEVGKTLIAAALILKIKALLPAQSVLGFKPVVAGTYQADAGAILNEDIESLKLACAYEGDATDLCPYLLPTPAAPHLVANALGIELSIEKMREAYDALRQSADWMIVEGAGGFLVPMNDHQDLGDFAQALRLPVILVVGMRLGCINHALLTEEAIEARGLKLGGWVANTIDPSMAYLSKNIETLQARISAPLLGTVGHLPASAQKKPNSPYALSAMHYAADALYSDRIARLIA